MVSDIINVFVYSSFGSWQFLSDAEWELHLTAWWFLVLACLYADWIVCFPYIETGKASEFGQLKDGYMFETSTGLSRMWEDVNLAIGLSNSIRTDKCLSDFFFLFISYLLFFRLLSSPTCPVLEALGKTLSYEIAVGLNGRVWVSYYHSWCYSVLIIGTKEKLL